MRHVACVLVSCAYATEQSLKESKDIVRSVARLVYLLGHGSYHIVSYVRWFIFMLYFFGTAAKGVLMPMALFVSLKFDLY